MPLGQRYRRGKHYQIGAAENLGGDTTGKVADHSGFRHEAGNQICVRNGHRDTPAASELCQRLIHDAAIVSRQSHQDVGCRHVGFEIDRLTVGPARVFASDDTDISVGKKSFSPDALRHVGKRGEDQVDVAAIEQIQNRASFLVECLVPER
jgi:hypothetical protein